MEHSPERIGLEATNEPVDDFKEDYLKMVLDGKHANLERVVGKMTENERNEIARNIITSEYLDSEKLLMDFGTERKHTPGEIQAIEEVNKYTNDIRKKYKLGNINWPDKNVFITEKIDSGRMHGGLFDPLLQKIYFRDHDSLLTNLRYICHEMIHAKSYCAMQLTQKKRTVKTYRSGLNVFTRNTDSDDEKSRYFESLDEAVTEELTKRYMDEQLRNNNPLYANEVNVTYDIIKEEQDFSRDEAKNHDDVKMWGRIGEGEIYMLTRGGGDKPKQQINYHRYGYSNERKMLLSLCEKIANDDADNFNDKEAVFEMFVKAKFTGNILPLGRTIDGLYGKGTFRKIGEMDAGADAQKEFIQNLISKK